MPAAPPGTTRTVLAAELDRQAARARQRLANARDGDPVTWEMVSIYPDSAAPDPHTGAMPFAVDALVEIAGRDDFQHVRIGTLSTWPPSVGALRRTALRAACDAIAATEGDSFPGTGLASLRQIILSVDGHRP